MKNILVILLSIISMSLFGQNITEFEKEKALFNTPIKVQSKNLDLIEKTSLEVPELIDAGIELNSSFPVYYNRKVTDKDTNSGKKIAEVMNRQSDITTYLGASYNSQSAKLKETYYSTGFNAGLFIPLLKRANYTFGFGAEGEYFSSARDQFGTLSMIKVQGATSIKLNLSSSGSLKTSGYMLGISPQVNFFIGKHFIFSPMFEIGYLKVSGKSLIATQTTLIATQGTIVDTIEYNHVLFSGKVSMISGLAMIPKVRMSYMFSRNIGLWVEANYIFGPTTESIITKLIPKPEPNSNGEYDIEQLNNGNTITDGKRIKFNSIGLGIGLVFTFDTPHHIPKKEPTPVIPQETNSKDDSDSQVCANLNVDFIKEDNSDSLIYSLNITNNYTGTNLNNKPKSFNIIIKENAITKIEEPVSAGLSRTPISIPPDTKEVSWNSSLFIPNGETKLGKLRFAKDASIKFTIVYEWLNKNQKTICKDSISFNESKYYYDLNKENNNYTEVYDKLLNVQFSNEYASSENLKIKIYDVKTKKLVSRKSDKSLSVNSLNGLNRITIDLKDYQLNPGALYLLIISDSNINYNFNFKITDKIINDREK
ncbi:MAG: hypothetical protein EXR20_03440 [Bacteroidetes bacterium]|nr:hypothetical protein [Bacteroidota bacterium]